MTFKPEDFMCKDLPVWIVSCNGFGVIVGHTVVGQSRLRTAPHLDSHYVPAPLPEREFVVPYWTGKRWVEKAKATSAKRKIVRWGKKKIRAIKGFIANLKRKTP